MQYEVKLQRRTSEDHFQAQLIDGHLLATFFQTKFSKVSTTVAVAHTLPAFE